MLIKTICKDLWIHIILTIGAILVICKFSSLPTCCAFFESWLLKPEEETISYELFRIAENLSLAYIAALVFHIIVNYLPKKREEKRTFCLVRKNITEIYSSMCSVLGYFHYALDVSDFSGIGQEQIEKIDNFSFPSKKEFILTYDSRNNISNNIEYVLGRQVVIGIGKSIERELQEIEQIISCNSIDSTFIDLMYKLKFSGLMEKMLRIFSEREIVIKDVVVQETYLNLHADLIQFEDIKNELGKYEFVKSEKCYRKPTKEELEAWVKCQKTIREKCPYIDDIYNQLKSK